MAIRKNIWSGSKESIRKKSKNRQPEYNLQKSICSYLDIKYNKIFYNGSAGGQYQKYHSQRTKNKLTGYKSGFPDLFIYEPKGKYNGLAIELKVKGNYPSPNQKKVIGILNEKGYLAKVCTGFEEATDEIDSYLNL